MLEQDTLAETPVETLETAAPAAETPALETAATDVTQETDQTEADETPEEFGVEISHPKRDGEVPEKFNLQVPDQKTADALRYHLNRSREYTKLSQEYETAQESVRTVEALERDPVAGMYALGEDPKVASAFVQGWVRENYEAVAEMLQAIGIETSFAKGVDRRVLDAEAKVARIERAEHLRRTQQQAQGSVVQQQFTQRGRQVVTDLAATIPFGDEDDREMFEALSGKALGKLYKDNQYASPADMTAALQGVVAKFTGRATQTIKATAQPRDDAGRFERTKERNGKMAKIGSGNSGLSAVTGQIDPHLDLETYTRQLEGRA